VVKKIKERDVERGKRRKKLWQCNRKKKKMLQNWLKTKMKVTIWTLPNPLGYHGEPLQFFVVQVIAQMTKNGKEIILITGAFLNSFASLSPNRLRCFTPPKGVATGFSHFPTHRTIRIFHYFTHE
jgi:hypothetical protein